MGFIKVTTTGLNLQEIYTTLIDNISNILLVLWTFDLTGGLEHCLSKDPCSTAKELFEPYQRFKNCKYNESLKLCDRYLQPRWYKSYVNMHQTCPNLLECGALYPIWLKGELPASEGMLVTGKTCKVGFSNCCIKEYDIQIKHCGGFMAYCLVAVDGCPERYCFGEKGKCDSRYIPESTTVVPYNVSTQRDIINSSASVEKGSNATQCDTDPCDPENIVQIPDLDKRDKGCTYSPRSDICDQRLQKRWYTANVSILTNCPNPLSCGTFYPVWMNGSLPSKEENIVKREACTIGLQGNCCEKSYTIFVRTCTNYTAYCLESLDKCDERYCFGDTDDCLKHINISEMQETLPNNNKGTEVSVILPVTVSVSVATSIIILVIMSLVCLRRNRNMCCNDNVYDDCKAGENYHEYENEHTYDQITM